MTYDHHMSKISVVWKQLKNTWCYGLGKRKGKIAINFKKFCTRHHHIQVWKDNLGILVAQIKCYHFCSQLIFPSYLISCWKNTWAINILTPRNNKSMNFPWNFHTWSGRHITTISKTIILKKLLHYRTLNSYEWPTKTCLFFLKRISFQILSWPFNSHEWPRQNFSLQYRYNINQISDENREKYQFGDN